MTAAELIKRCQKGDRIAQAELFRRFKGMVMGISLRYCPQKAEAEDVFQECFIRIFHHLDRVQNPDSLPGWVRTLAVHTAIDHWKKRSRQLPLESAETLQETNSGNTGSDFDHLDEEALLSLLHSLPEHLRLVFNLFAIEGFNHKEITERLGITELTSRVFLSRARQRLQALVLEWNHPKTDYHVR